MKFTPAFTSCVTLKYIQFKTKNWRTFCIVKFDCLAGTRWFLGIYEQIREPRVSRKFENVNRDIYVTELTRYVDRIKTVIKVRIYSGKVRTDLIALRTKIRIIISAFGARVPEDGS